MAVFPHFGSLGYSSSSGVRAVMRVYDNGQYRRYRRSTFNHKEVELNFSGVKQSVKDDVVNFFNARLTGPSNDFSFLFYNPEETSVIDPTGTSAVGRHTAIFTNETLDVTRDGKCRWSLRVRVKFLD